MSIFDGDIRGQNIHSSGWSLLDTNLAPMTIRVRGTIEENPATIRAFGRRVEIRVNAVASRLVEHGVKFVEVTLDPGENDLASAVIDVTNGYAYFGTDTYTARVVKVAELSPDISTMMQSYNAAPGPKQHSMLSRTSTNCLMPFC